MTDGLCVVWENITHCLCSFKIGKLYPLKNVYKHKYFLPQKIQMCWLMYTTCVFMREYIRSFTLKKIQVTFTKIILKLEG